MTNGEDLIGDRSSARNRMLLDQIYSKIDIMIQRSLHPVQLSKSSLTYLHPRFSGGLLKHILLGSFENLRQPQH